ncbi:coiled-coil-helix-coiled-coil-helix domain-containing protein 5 [Eudromia elegans]
MGGSAAWPGSARPGSVGSGPLSSRRQAALEVTARYCGSEMEQYGRCVAASPASWQRDCHALRLSMARCAAAHPIVRQIRQDCAEPFAAFERCLRENQAAVANCAEHVDRFLLCADRVKPSA